MFQTNLRETDATMDVGSVADFIQDFGADTWLVNAGGILSFYPTDLDFQTRNPYLAERSDGDLVGAAIDEAHARGMRIITRMDFSKVHRRIADAHPEWCFRSPEGELQVYNGLVSVCPSGEYYHDRTLDILDEFLERYPTDGFFFNWFGFNETDYSKVYHGVCHCENCVSAFREAVGADLPSGPDCPGYDVWKGFAAARIDLVTDRIRHHIASRRANVGLILGKKADIVFHEANNAIGREFWVHATEQAVSGLKSAKPDASVLVNSVIFFDMPYRMSGEQPQVFGQYLLQAIARGANPSTYIMGTPGDIPYPAFPVAREVTRFHAAHREVYEGLTQAAKLLLIEPVPFERTADEREDALKEFRGVFSALVERHVPFDVLPQSELADLGQAGGLDRFEAIVLPDLGSLGQSNAETLDTWVGAGGSLILTGSSGLSSEGEAELSASPVLRRTGSKRGFQALRSSYVVGTYENSDGIARYGRPIAGLHGVLSELEWRPAAESRLIELAPAPFGPPEKAYGNVPSGRPGFGCLRAGKGLVIHVPWTVGLAYRELGLSVYRDLFVDEVLGAAGWSAGLLTDLPEQVELIVGRNGNDLVVHLNNLSGVRTASIGAHLVVNGGHRLQLQGWGSTEPVRALVAGSECPVTIGGDVAEIKLPEIGAFEVLVIPGGAAVIGRA